MKILLFAMLKMGQSIVLTTLIALVGCTDTAVTSPDAGIDAPVCKLLVQQDDPCPNHPGTVGILCAGDSTYPEHKDCIKESDVPWYCCCTTQGCLGPL